MTAELLQKPLCHGLKIFLGPSLEGPSANHTILFAEVVAGATGHDLVGQIEEDIVLFLDVAPDEVDVPSGGIHEDRSRVRVPAPGRR